MRTTTTAKYIIDPSISYVLAYINASLQFFFFFLKGGIEECKGAMV